MVSYAVLWHFFIKLSFAAPESGLPFLSMAFGSQASFVHFAMKLLNAAPASGFPSFPMALVIQLCWAKTGVVTEPTAKAATIAANTIVLIAVPSVISDDPPDRMVNNEYNDGADDRDEHAP